MTQGRSSTQETLLGGLAIIERAIVQAESTLVGRERAFGLGVLHLRALTLAGRLKDKQTAQRHIDEDWRMAEKIPEEMARHGMQFGPVQTATHVISTASDMEQHRKTLETADDLIRSGLTLTANRVAPVYMNLGRSQLALGDQDSTLESSERAWVTSPEMAAVHPTSLELTRVLVVKRKRSNERLTRIARRAGVNL